jgi:hypothetical protein
MFLNIVFTMHKIMTFVVFIKFILVGLGLNTR